MHNPVLQENIKCQDQDIDDLERETITCKSKDISACAGGIRLTPEEIQEGKIIGVKIKLERDRKEIEEIEQALSDIINDACFQVISLRYFEGLNDNFIASQVPCDERTVRRNRSRIMKKIALKLYGAEAL